MKARTLILTAGAALALAAPAAQAMPLYPEGDGPAASRYSTQPLQAVRPDDRAGVRGVDTAAVVMQAVRPDDRAGALGIGETPVEVVTSSPSSGVDWRYVGIGIGSAGALLLLGASLAVTSRRHSASALG